jgi:hypothetical protein
MRVLKESTAAMSHSMTSNGLTAASSIVGETAWPNVTIPSDEFDAHAKHVSLYLYGGVLWVTPLVNDLEAWDAYSASPTFVFGVDGKGPANGTGPFTPIHQVYPKLSDSIINYDTTSEPGVRAATLAVTNLRKCALSGLLMMPFIRDSFPSSMDSTEPISMLVAPIFNTFNRTSSIVGYVQSLFAWRYFLTQFVAAENFVCVVKNSCGSQFSIMVTDASASYIENEDAHDAKFDRTFATTILGMEEYTANEIEMAKEAGICVYTIYVYPTIDFRQSFHSYSEFYTAMVGVTMLIMVGSFFAYDR